MKNEKYKLLYKLIKSGNVVEEKQHYGNSTVFVIDIFDQLVTITVPNSLVETIRNY